MDISLTFTPSASLNRHRRPFPPAGGGGGGGAGTRRFAAAGCRRATTSGELQTAAGPNGRGGSYPASVPVHKVTVHDRQRGVVHEFSVPEGYALLCVGYPSSDLEVETQDEDEVYWLQFGRYFARGPIDRDDYALELALGDE